MMKHEMAVEVRHCRAVDILKIEGEGEAVTEFVELVDKYLEPFAAPAKGADGKPVCIKCGERQDSFMQALGMGVACSWGIVHGEARCTGCGWPYRGMHYVKRDGEEKEALTMRNFFLPYHPDHVEVRGTVDKIKDALAGRG